MCESILVCHFPLPLPRPNASPHFMGAGSRASYMRPWLHGCEASCFWLNRNSQHFTDLYGQNHSCENPAILEVTRREYDALPVFLRFLEDPEKASEIRSADRLFNPRDISAAWRFARMHDTPTIAIALKQYAHAAPYGYNMLGDSESCYEYRHPQSHLADSRHRLGAFAMAAAMQDYMLCARLLEQNGGTDMFTQPTQTGQYFSPDQWEAGRIKERYAGKQAEMFHIFDPAGWSREIAEDVGLTCMWALMRAKQVVGAYYREPDWAVEADYEYSVAGYGTKIGDWTWAEVAHDFRGFMGLHNGFFSARWENGG